MKILAVLRSGGDFSLADAYSLQVQCSRHAPGVPFVLLSDDALRHGWPGWWSKMELFRFPGPALYLDLDSVIVGDLTPLLGLAAREPFVALRDFYRGGNALQSSVMAWSGDMSHLYETFKADPGRHMAECTQPQMWGDQGFIDAHQRDRKYWQDLLPGALCSYKVHVQGRGIPCGCSVVVFHGRPRPSEVELNAETATA